MTLNILLFKSCSSYALQHETNSLELGPIQICNDLINRYETETGQTSPIPRGLSEEEIILRDDVIQEAQSRAERLIHLAGLFLERIYSSGKQCNALFFPFPFFFHISSILQ